MTVPNNKSTPKQSQEKLSVENQLHMGVKVGLLHTTANAIYPTPAGKIREAAANAQDNGASWMVIYSDRTAKTLSLFDNGSGITPERFKLIFESIGSALLSGLEGKLSYFGLGLMSVFKLGKTIKIFTRPRGERDILLVEIDAAAIFDEKNKDENISFLDSCIKPIRIVTPIDRAASPAPILDDILSEELFGGFPDSYTEIVIEEVSSDLDATTTPDFEEELRKLLPLKYEKDEPFLQKFENKETRDRVIRVLDNKDYCPTIDVFLGIEGEREVHQLWKYFPKFRANLTFAADSVRTGIADSGEFSYYIVHTIAEDFYRKDDRRSEENRETGFYVRNNNYLVKGPHYLEKPGPGARIIHVPLRNWVFGEFFHKDMNSFLTVARNDYLYQKDEFAAFRSQVVSLIGDLNEKLRTQYQATQEIRASLIEPFTRFASPDGTLKKTEDKLKRLMGPGVSDKELREQLFKKLEEMRDQGIEDRDTRIDVLIEKSKEPIVLGEDENVVVKVDPSIKGKIQEYKLDLDAKNKRVAVVLSPDLFSPRSVVFLGETWEVFFITQQQNNVAVSFDTDNKQMFVNPFNEILTDYSVSMLDIWVAMEVAYRMSTTMESLKNTFLSLLGPPKTEIAKYVIPLGDDLRRTLRFAREG